MSQFLIAEPVYRRGSAGAYKIAYLLVFYVFLNIIISHEGEYVKIK